MKLKFTKEVWATIERVAALDLECKDASHYKDPEIFILRLLEEAGTIDHDPKYRAKVRRETSMLLGFIATAVKQGRGPQSTYMTLIRSCRGIVNLDSLKHPAFINLAASYGVIRFSDVELEKIIEVNTVPEFLAEVAGCKLEPKPKEQTQAEGETVISGVSDAEAEFYALYLGDSGRGRVKHHADFNTKEDALELANTYLRQGFVSGIVDKTHA